MTAGSGPLLRIRVRTEFRAADGRLLLRRETMLAREPRHRCRRSIGPFVNAGPAAALRVQRGDVEHAPHPQPTPATRRASGYPDVLVQSHLHAAFLMRALRDAVVPGGRARRGLRRAHPKHIAVPGDTLTCDGRKVGEDGPPGDVRAAGSGNGEGVVCAQTASATVRYA